MAGVLQTILIPLIILIRQAYGSDFCDERPSGYYADPSTCYKYYQCDAHGATFSIDCAPGLIWDEGVLTCVLDPYNGNCMPTVNANTSCLCAGITYCVNQSMRYSGPEVKTTALADSTIGCARACSESPNHCRSFNFFPAQKICEMFSTVPSSGVISDVLCIFVKKCSGE